MIRIGLVQGLGGVTLALLALVSCTGFEERAAIELADKPDARILAIGDSVVWWNSEQGASIADGIAEELGEPVVNLAIPGAAISHRNRDMTVEGLDIRAQYRPRSWDWVVVEGGANDLGDEGAARGCETVLDELVSADGRSGEIPGLVGRIRADGSRVVVLGYYELLSGAESDGFCGNTLSALTGRLEIMTALDQGVLFVAMADSVSPTEPAAYDRDGVHPSARSSRAIGKAIAANISKAEMN